MKFNISLLREKFVIREKDTDEDTHAKKLNIVAPSTRMPVSLSLQSSSLPPEDFVIRTHNMHSCARMAAKLITDFEKRGPIMSRQISLKWDKLWEDCLTPYERAHVENLWVCIYHKGKPIFQTGEHHSFLDVIEKCDSLNKGKYDDSIAMAERAFKQAGTDVTITYDSNVALVAELELKKSRCGMILRNPVRTTTFNITIEEIDNTGHMNIALGLMASADFLEGIQLAFFVGAQQEKLRRGDIKEFSPEYKKMREARSRIVMLDAEIGAIENMYKVRYRPEKPSLQEIVTLSERIARKAPPKDEVYVI
jgi:hypothetical protein